MSVNRLKPQASKVISSGPQGTVLAPILFLIFLSDIDKNTRRSNVSSFAEDAKIKIKILAVEDITTLLQEDIVHGLSWPNKNNMELSEEKRQLIRYGKTNISKIKVNTKTKSNKTRSQTNDVNDLGIVMYDNLTFSNHYHITI